MPVPTDISQLTTNEATNHPADSETITASTRPSDYLRAHAAIIKTLEADVATDIAAHAAAADPHTGYALESALGTASTKNTGTTSGTVPLVGTASDSEALAGLSRRNTTAEAEAGTLDEGHMTPLKTAQAIAALGLGGSGQTWQDVKTSPGRALNTTYTNTTGKPIAVNIQTTNTGSSQAILTVGGVAIYGSSPGTATPGFAMTVSAIVPVWATYIASNTNQTLDHWRELTA